MSASNQELEVLSDPKLMKQIRKGIENAEKGKTESMDFIRESRYSPFHQPQPLHRRTPGSVSA